MIGYYKEYKNFFFTFIIVAFVLYGNSLGNKYAIDDDYVTVTNFPEKGKEYIPNNKPVSKGFRGIPQILKSRYAHDNDGSFDYRPVTSVSFAIEYAFFGQSPFLSHLINVILYALNILVLFCVMLKLFESYANKLLIASLAAFIFLILPIHSEVVNNIKSRDEILAFLFPLLSLWYSLKAYDKFSFKNLAFILLFFLLGFYSKRTAMIFFGIIPLSLILFRKINFKKAYWVLVLLFSYYGINTIVRKQVISQSHGRVFYGFENPMFMENFSFFEKLLAGLKSIGFYIKFSIVPYPFRNYYGTGVVDISSAFDLHLLIAISFLAGSCWYFYKTRNKIFLFGFLLFLGGIAPFSNAITPVAGVMGERLAYNASFGIAIMASVLIASLYHYPVNFSLNLFFKKPTVYFMPVIVIYTLLIWTRNADWKDKLTLFENDIQHLERSAKANSMLGNEYFEMLLSKNPKYPAQTLVQKGLQFYNAALKNDSSFYSAYNNAGVLYFNGLQDYHTAEAYFKKALKVRPVYPQAYENLGDLYKLQNKKEEALNHYLKAISQNKKQFNAYISCIRILYEEKNYLRAISICKDALIHFPENYTLTGQEADCLYMLGKQREALEKYEEAYRIYPSKELANYLYIKYQELGDKGKSSFYQNK